jgi:hypothetical protein
MASGPGGFTGDLPASLRTPPMLYKEKEENF